MGSRNPERVAPTLSDGLTFGELVKRFEQWRLEAYCVPCMRANRLDPRKLCEQYGPAETVGALKRRLKCIRCGGRGERPQLRAVLRHRRER